MYFAVIVLLMLVLPAGSTVAEFLLSPGSAGWLPLIGKWFVFWGVGVRLLVAGIRQIARPALTVEMLGIKDGAAGFLARELGFANFAIGITGLLSLAYPAWTAAAACYGAIFYIFAGVQHALAAHRDNEQNWAMASDLAMGVLLGIVVVMTLLHP